MTNQIMTSSAQKIESVRYDATLAIKGAITLFSWIEAALE